MTVKEHYDNHLGFFYSWMMGEFEENKNEFQNFCKTQKVYTIDTKIAIDLGAGNGIQSIALAELGYRMIAIDFNQTLLDELESRKNELVIKTISADLRDILDCQDKKPELIVCCGDTISHLDSEKEISTLIEDINNTLIADGKIVLSFRDYAMELTDTMRFIPVKSDSKRILTCYLEYFDEKVRVTDLLYEKLENKWIQKVSSYEKVRTTREMILKILVTHGFSVISETTTKGMITIIGQKN